MTQLTQENAREAVSALVIMRLILKQKAVTSSDKQAAVHWMRTALAFVQGHHPYESALQQAMPFIESVGKLEPGHVEYVVTVVTQVADALTVTHGLQLQPAKGVIE